MNITSFSMVKQSTVIDCKCDVCGLLSGKPYPDDWFNFYHRHSDWGNDSGDSVESFDVCSPQCFYLQLQKSLNDLAGYKTAEIAGMPYKFVEKLLKTQNLQP